MATVTNAPHNNSLGLLTKQIQEFSKVSALARKTLLISVGAVVLFQETLSSLTIRCIDRGAVLEAETKKYAGRVVNEILTTARIKKAEVKKSASAVSKEEVKDTITTEKQDKGENNL